MQIKWIIKLSLLLVSATLLCGCASMNGGYGARANRPALSAEAYLQMANNAEGAKRNGYLLKAANGYILNRKPTDAQRVLNQIDIANLPAPMITKKEILQANVFILRKQYQTAINALNAINKSQTQLANNDSVALHELLAYAYQQKGNLPASLNERTSLQPLLKNSQAKQDNINTIWSGLQTQTPKTLSAWMTKNTTPNVQGWLSLALITKENQNNPAQLIQALQAWHARYPKHLGTALLPKNLQNQTVSPPPKHIALLLPLSGRLASSSDAVRNGFFAAYYYAKQKGQAAPIITVLDTSKSDINSVYQKAIAEGATVIVGPLTKNNVAKLTQSTRLSVPTLALNSIGSQTSNGARNFYQFGLSPTDEAKQDAIKAWSDHYTRALILAPSNKWGQSVAKAFEDQWQTQGGQTVAAIKYTNQASLSTDVSTLLNVHLAETQAKALRHVLRTRFRYVPRRRQDANVIFMVANPRTARIIKPLLRFYFAGNLPVYATSQVYSGIPNPERDRDLNGIIFCGMPWVLQPNHMQPAFLDSIQTEIKSVWPKSYNKHPKLYALGVDAYDLVSKLNQMALFNQFGLNAATGTLYLNNANQVYQKLLWAQFKQGTPTIIE